MSAFVPLRASAPPFSGLLGIHVRRGDFARHCKKLAGWGSDYNVWNLLGKPEFHAKSNSNDSADPQDLDVPQLPDYLTVPPGVSRHDAAYAHCWPTAEAIVERVHAIRAELTSGVAHSSIPGDSTATNNDGIELDTIYIATNGHPPWVHDLAAQLRADGWARVSSSLDLELSKDETAVANAVDMAVLVAAEAFIGVGVRAFPFVFLLPHQC